MKKLFTILVILISAASLFASFDYRLELLSFKPTFKESSADRSRPALDFQYAGVYKGYPEYFYQNENKFITCVEDETRRDELGFTGIVTDMYKLSLPSIILVKLYLFSEIHLLSTASYLLYH